MVNKSSKNNKCWAEIFMQTYYATEVNSWSVYLTSVQQDPTRIKDSESMLHTRPSGALVQICCSSFVWSFVALLPDEVMKSKHLETLQN